MHRDKRAGISPEDKAKKNYESLRRGFFQESNDLDFLKFAYEPLIPALELLLGCDV